MTRSDIPKRQFSSVFVCGSLALDTIARIDGSFGTLNVKLRDVTTRFGGCGGNIAYNLAQLGCQHSLFASAGEADFDDYFHHLNGAGVNLTHVHRAAGGTANAFIFTADDGRQFTGFAPGRIAFDAARLESALAAEQPDVAIVGPAPLEEMRAQFDALEPHCPIVWSPGQYAELLPPEDARALKQRAQITALNAEEHKAVGRDTAGLTIVTDGAAPICVYTKGRKQQFEVPAAEPVDPTGCGDAFLAGFVSTWLSDQQDLPGAVSVGVRTAAACLANYGSQAHVVRPSTHV